VVERHGGNWLDSQFAHLAGKFAGLVLVELEDSRSDALEAAVADLLDSVGWKIEVSPAVTDDLVGQAPESGTEPVSVHLLGQDRPGLVHQIASALADQHASIEDFRSWTVDGPQGGGVLFEAEAVVRLAPGADAESLADALEPIADELMVDLEFHAAE
jgi:glycine cleavage system regulatory protein